MKPKTTAAERRGRGPLRLALLPLVLSLSACDRGAKPEVDAAQGTDGYPLVLSSADGTTVRIAARVGRCLPANANASDLVLALADDGRVCGVPATAFSYGNVALDLDEWEGRRLLRYEGESILALKPDLVVAQGMQNPDAGRVLSRAGLPVLVLPEVDSVGQLEDAIRLLGRALEVEARAAELVLEVRRRVEALSALEWKRPWRVAPYSNYGTGGWTAGRGTTAELYVELAGLRNAVVEAGLVGHFHVDTERLFEIDPDVLLVPSSIEDADHSPTAEMLRSDPTLSKLRAVAEGHIVVLHPRLLSTSSHHVLTTAERLAEEVRKLLEDG